MRSQYLPVKERELSETGGRAGCYRLRAQHGLELGQRLRKVAALEQHAALRQQRPDRRRRPPGAPNPMLFTATIDRQSRQQSQPKGTVAALTPAQLVSISRSNASSRPSKVSLGMPSSTWTQSPTG